jgi:hypothetical protein
MRERRALGIMPTLIFGLIILVCLLAFLYLVRQKPMDFAPIHGVATATSAP